MPDRVALMALKMARSDGARLLEREMIAQYRTMAAVAVAALDSMTDAERAAVLAQREEPG